MTEEANQPISTDNATQAAAEETTTASAAETTTTQAATTETKQDWADDWRVKLAGEDEKSLKQLERFTSPKALYESYRSLQQKIDSGEFVRPLPKDADEAALNEWRKANGIPESPEGYDLSFDNGLVIGEADKPLIDKFVSAMHGTNATPAQVKTAVATYYAMQEDMKKELAEIDAEAATKAEATLRAEWGNEYKANLNIFNNWLDALPQESKTSFMNARLADGSVLASNPDVMRLLVNTLRDANPIPTITGAAGKDAVSAMEDEIDSIRDVMRNDPDKYYRDEKMQARLRTLLDAKERTRAA